MSRSNPQADKNPHPSTRWFEWNGGDDGGFPRYYNKDKKATIALEISEAKPFTFLVLDETATVTGWSESNGSGIRSNEIRDISKEPFVVKAFGEKSAIANGLWANIRDRATAAGGKFTANIYIAYRSEGELRIGCLQLSGAAFSSWLEFKKANRDAVYAKAITIGSYTEGKKGKIVFRVPVFGVRDVAPETDEQAKQLDASLQTYFKEYFSRNRGEHAAPQEHAGEDYADQNAADPTATETDDIPF